MRGGACEPCLPLLGWTAPERHRCAMMRLPRTPAEETVRGADYPHWNGHVKAPFPASWREWSGGAGLALKASAQGDGRFFEKLPSTEVAIEACGGSNHWARTLQALGHTVKLIPPQFVKPYVKRGKNDAADAEALCEAMSRPTMRFVPVKSAEQQAALMLVGLRDRLIRQRTQLTNAIRGYAAEFGLSAAKGLIKIDPLLERIQDDPSLPLLAKELFAAHADEYRQLRKRLEDVEAKLMAWHRADATSRRLAQVPGIGPVGASLLVMKTPAPDMFRSARHFAAWLGLTPKDHSTAGKVRLGVITRAGDETLRSVLVTGATSVIQQVRRGRGAPSAWLIDLLNRKPPKLAAVALANKMARIAWKLMASGESYRVRTAPPKLAIAA